jgi:enoyl-CoA hydratase/carnithine racemase
MSSNPDSGVEFTRPREHVGLVTLSRPQVRNAINSVMAHELDRLVKVTEADPDVWAVVLTGAGGKAFCSGADLREVSEGRLEHLYTVGGGFAGFVNGARSKPWIAAVDGMAVAGGFEIALACDMIIASDDAEFGLPEVTRGLLAAAGGAYRLPRSLPRMLAFELIATGARISAERALSLHLVNAVVPKVQTLESALDLASRICANAPIAVRESLRIARQAFDLDGAALSRESLDAQSRLMVTDDFREGPIAFLEKRPPRWKAR